MSKNNDKYFDYIIHGGDYNPEQWIDTPEIWDEDMRLMNLAHINSATVGIFSWATIEPREGEYDFSFLDEIMDKLAQNNKKAILATPSGARPAWLAEKYPEVLRVSDDGIRNYFGVRHNHCMTSPLYREKVYEMNRRLAERYKNHPALAMWHISNEYSGECHCELCQEAFRGWLRERYDNDLDKLNRSWWNSFWSHTVTDWSQIHSPSNRGENNVPVLKLNWWRFVSDSHISFFENEIKPLREITPHVPITTNFMRMYDGIDYQKFAKHVDLVSWDNYPEWGIGKDIEEALEVAFVHDAFRSMKHGKPFFMMESTPSLINWRGVNKLQKPGMQELSAIHAVAHGSDSVQYFQWRKSRGGHEKYHGAVVDHCGHENTRVFREVAHTGEILEKLHGVVGKRSENSVAIVFDWENDHAIKYFCGYNNEHRNYLDVCVHWHNAFEKIAIGTDIIPMDSDFSKYKIIVAPFLYMLKDGTAQRIKEFVKNGGIFVGTYLTAVVDKDDLCFLGGVPGDGLREVFGIWSEEVDSLLPHEKNFVLYKEKIYDASHTCEIIHTETAKIQGKYESDFYKDTPAVTKNSFGKGFAYYTAFRNDSDFADDFCSELVKESGIKPILEGKISEGIDVAKRGEYIFIMNFSDKTAVVKIGNTYENVLTKEKITAETEIPSHGYIIIKEN